MATSNETTVTIGPGLPTLLTVLFVALKLLGYISWSWWWVLCPLWIPLAIVIAFLLVAGVVTGIAFLAAVVIDKINKR